MVIVLAVVVLPHNGQTVVTLGFGGVSVRDDHSTYMHESHRGAAVDLRRLRGYWTQEGTASFDYRLIIDNEILLQNISDPGYVIRLKLKQVKGALYLFEPDSNPSKGIQAALIAIQIVPTDSLRTWQSIQLSFMEGKNKWSSPITLKKPDVPTDRSIRIFSGNDFLYVDSAEGVDSKPTLRQAVSRLAETGRWKCLSQSEITVRQGQNSVLTSREVGVDRLYLIYSPGSSNRLLYNIVPKESGTLEGSLVAFPVFYSRNQTFFGKNTILRFSMVLPSQAEATNREETPITVYIFGRAPGDYGSGCRV